MSSVSLSGVSLAYPGGQLGLADVDLTVRDGEFVALVGPSGSGKTTLLRTVAGFVHPTAGSVSIADSVVADSRRSLEPERRGLGMVFQQHAVWPHWSVGRNIEYPLKRAGVAKPERITRVAEALELVGLAGYSKRNPATLSGGQRQRVAIARAIVARPRVLLLDEALSALDEPLRDRLRLELRELTRELGLTVLHVTHDRAEALAVADRIVVLDGGRIQQVGAPAALLTEPSSAFVASFMADATVLAGTTDDLGFVSHQSGLFVPVDALSAPGGWTSLPTGAANIALLPHTVRAVPDIEGTGRVVSSLFGRDGDDLVVDWNGVRIRSRVPGARCAPGTRVRLEIEQALIYSSTDTRGSFSVHSARRSTVEV